MFRTFQRWHIWLIVVIVAIGALAPAFPLLHSVFQKAHASGGSASITLSSPTGQPGATVQVSGQGFAPNQLAAIYWNVVGGTPLASATSDASGNLPATNITVPDQPTGQYSVIAIQTNANIMASAVLSVVPVISLSKTVVDPGENVTVIGKGFMDGDYVNFFLDSITGNSFSYVISPGYDFSVSVRLPNSSIVQGPHTIIAKGYSQLTATAAVTFTPHLSPIAAKPGLSVQLTGAAFAANETVSVYWGTASGQLEGTPTTDSTGNLSFTFTAPQGLQPGAYPITVVRSHQKPARIATLFNFIPLTLTSTPGIHSGQTANVRGTGFLADETVIINWNANGGQLLLSAVTNTKGAFQAWVTPPSAPPGTYVLTATGSKSGLQASANLSIGPGISGNAGDPGGTVTINGGGFSINETLNIYIQTPANGEIQVTTDATGSFNTQLTLPSTYDPTVQYYVYAVSTSNKEHARTRFSFFKPAFTVTDATYQQPVRFFGVNFAVNETVNLIWNYQRPDQYTIGTVTTGSWDGGFNNYSLPAPSTPNESSITVAAVGVTSHLVLTATIQNNAAIYTSSYTGKAGAKITVTGGSFGAASPIALYFQGTLLPTAITSKTDGSFSGTFKVPAVTGAGNITLEASDTVDQSTTITATTPFFYTPVLTVSPTIVHNGDTLLVKGSHFSANSFVSLYSTGSPFNGPGPYTDFNGSFTITIPVQGQVGANYVYARFSDIPQAFVSAAFVIE